MANSTELFCAILSLDAYNRGYGEGSLPWSGTVGTVELINPLIVGRTETQYQDWQSAGFYAAAYQDANGNNVISYRGTDAPLTADITAWSGGA